MEDFDFAYAYESGARAYALAGAKEAALKYLALAEEAGEAIGDEENKKYFLDDLNAGDWYGIR